MRPLAMKRMDTKRLLLLCALGLSGFSGCTCHSTDSTEVGVVTRKITFFGLLGKEGVQDEVYAPGATYFFLPFTTDWHTFDVSLQNLAMVREAPSRGDKKGGGGGGEDEGANVKFKTVDGNDIRVDVTVVWQIDPKKAAHVLTSVGEDTRQVQEKLLRPACRSVVRDVLNELHSEGFYVSEKRFEKADRARDRLQAVLGPEGVLVQQVILGEHKFSPEYEQVIRDKKLAEQNAEKLRSEAKAAAEEAKRKLETAKGQVAQQLAEADGYLEQVKLKADAAYFENQQRAEAILYEKKAAAEAIRKNNEALAGSGGRTMVKLKLAEALAGKEIIFVPTGGGGAQLQTLNLNALLKTYAGGGGEPEGAPISTPRLGQGTPP